MKLEQLFIQNYRNIVQADLSFSPKLNCFVGDNGMGKTNLLDSIYYLSFCRSSINHQDSQIVRHGAPCFQIQGSYIREDSTPMTVGCVAGTGTRKQFRRDRKEYQRYSDHIGLIPLVMISPSDTELISGGSEERRKFMDMVISQYDTSYLKNLIDYGKALSQRNALLKMEAEPDPELFLMWEQMMDSAGTEVYNKRRDFVEKLVPLFNSVYSGIGEQGEDVSLEYVSHLSRGGLLDQLTSNRVKERIVGYSLHGIHKDELEMNLSGYPIRREGSQGQNKSYLTALKLAQYMLLDETCGKKPLLLLDDIFDKLDARRVGRILDMVSDDSRFGQVFITDVSRNHLDGILDNIGCDYSLFTVESGTVL